jgi:hypothetical protein
MTFRLNRYVLILVLVASTASVCRSQEPPTHGLLKRADVERLLKSAQTREEFAQLAAYFDQRSYEFEQKARDEDRELERLSNATFRAKNYPIQVDRARNCGDYDRSEAKKYAKKALVFHQKAESAATDQSAGAAKQYE